MRIKTTLWLVGIALCAAVGVRAQNSNITPLPATRQRTVTTAPQKQQPSPSNTQTPRPAPSPTPQPVITQPAVPPATNTTQPANARPSTSGAASNPTPQTLPSPTATLPSDVVPQTPATSLAMSKIRSRLQEAERLLKSRPVRTVLTAPPVPSIVAATPPSQTIQISPSIGPSSTMPATSTAPSNSSALPSIPPPTVRLNPTLDFVTLTALEPETSKIHLLTVPKTIFLSKGAEVSLTTSLGTIVRLRIVRANGVNTAVTIFDGAGRSFVPLVVEYPIERNGALREVAYYTSAHPALLSPEVVKTGQAYVRSMLDAAAHRLSLKGVPISPQILDVAEHLCIVEHTDHDRFRKENRLALFEEIYSLYALNELDTYRYSVSFAGAGGMVQMIPSTYQMMRRLHPGAGLNPDFVAGMRNHGNALEAMLLYMDDVWRDLSSDPDVLDALNTKIATQAELLAAGYNSNPARLPLYIRRGGSAWRTLIPRETQTYLQIYRSVDSLVQIKPRR